MRLCKRAAVCGINTLRVSAVSTSAHTAVSISALTWRKLSAFSRAISKDAAHTYSNSIRSVTFSDGQVLGIGDYLNISIDGVNYQVDILGFHHDEVTDSSAYGGEYAGITWQLHNCYATAYAMNATGTNAGGWGSSQMRTARMASFLSGLSSDLSGVIVPVDKLTSAGNKSSTIVMTSDSLFLLSEIEIFGSTNFAASGEGSRYAYYCVVSDRRKYLGGSLAYWLERSPVTASSGYFCAVSTTGAGTASNKSADATGGVAFAFCT